MPFAESFALSSFRPKRKFSVDTSSDSSYQREDPQSALKDSKLPALLCSLASVAPPPPPHHQTTGGGNLADVSAISGGSLSGCSAIGADRGGDDSSEDSSQEVSRRKKKARTTFTGRQIFELEKQFEVKKYLSSSERTDMAKLLNVTETQVSRCVGSQRMIMLMQRRTT